MVVPVLLATLILLSSPCTQSLDTLSITHNIITEGKESSSTNGMPPFPTATPALSSTPALHSTSHNPINVTGLVLGLPLGALLLAVAFLIIAIALVIAVRIQLSRKEEEMPTAEYEVVEKIPTVVYEVVGPPQLPPRINPITTDVNVAYASIIQTHPNAAYANTSFKNT